jgi:hypothetical protein
VTKPWRTEWGESSGWVAPRSPLRWVYGTIAYDADTPGTTFWDHLVPVGLQWGSDPWSFPAVPQADTIWVAQETASVIRMRFKEWTGKSVFHCHILPYEDTGMMQNFFILPKPPQHHHERTIESLEKKNG